MKEVSTQMRVTTRLGKLRPVLWFFLLFILSVSVKAQSPTAPALGFNVFLQKGANLINNETEGPVAMGGDLTLSQNSYQVSTNYTGTFKVDNVPVTLVVGGKMNYNGGNGISINQNGYVKIGSAGASKVWYTDNNNAYSPIRITPGTDYNGSPRINLQANAQQLGVSATNNPVFQSGVIDFDAAFAKLKTSSSSFSICADNATLTDPNGNVLSAHTGLPNQVKINLHTGTNTLNLTGSDLNNVQVFTYNNKPDATHVLVINVNAAGSFNWAVWNSAGIGFQDCRYVLYNFYNTTALNIQSGAAVEGTVFAPFADINKTGNQSNIEGQVIAQSYLQNGGENHYAVFDPGISGCAVVCNLGVSGTKTDITCNGAVNGAINITATGANGTVSYLWNDGLTTEDRTSLAPGTYSVQATDANGCKATSSVFTISQPSAIGISGTTVNVSTIGGKNGSVDVTVSGSTSPYIYQWSDCSITTEDRTGLPAGSYTVTVTDKNGCSTNTVFIITEPVCHLTASVATTNVSCNGSANGSINVTPAGNNGAMTYMWNDGATVEDRSGLKPGSYCVQVTDAAGCKVTTPMYVISEPAAIGITGAVVNTTTAGGKDGSVNVTVSGGTSLYTYKWNDGVTTEDRKGLKAGTYTVTVTDKNGCSCTKAFVVSDPVCGIKLTGTVKPVSCNGGNDGAIDMTMSGNNGSVKYAWKDGPATEDRTNLAAGTYSVKATDAAGCTASCPGIVVKQPQPLQVTSTVTGQTSARTCNGTAKLSATGGTAPYTFTWSDGYKGASRNGLCMGAYQVSVMDKNGCGCVYTVKISCPGDAARTGITALSSSLTTSSADASLSPNPTTGLVRISINAKASGNATIVVYDLTGKPLIQKKISLAAGLNQQQLELSSLAKGLYQVKFTTDSGYKIFKVILE